MPVVNGGVGEFDPVLAMVSLKVMLVSDPYTKVASTVQLPGVFIWVRMPSVFMLALPETVRTLPDMLHTAPDVPVFPPFTIFSWAHNSCPVVKKSKHMHAFRLRHMTITFMFVNFWFFKLVLKRNKMVYYQSILRLAGS